MTDFNFGAEFETPPSTGRPLVNTLDAESSAASNLAYKKTDVREGTVRDVEVPVSSVGLIVRKSVDETLTATTTLQDDDHLYFDTEANTDYLIDMMLFHNLTTNNGGGVLDFNFTLPSGATYDAILLRGIGGSTVANVSVSEAANGRIASNGGDFVSSIKGVIRTGGSKGRVTFQWLADKNNPGDVVTVTIYKGSWMNVRPLSQPT